MGAFILRNIRPVRRSVDLIALAQRLPSGFGMSQIEASVVASVLAKIFHLHSAVILKRSVQTLILVKRCFSTVEGRRWERKGKNIDPGLRKK